MPSHSSPLILSGGLPVARFFFYVDNRNIVIIRERSHPEFPSLLREIANPPERLWFEGSIDFSAPSLAIVGTRKPTSYGREAAEYFSEHLAALGFTIVSGLALGIDTISHEAALKAGGKTVAVLGSGLDKIFPASNQRLAAKIKENGCLISEYPPGTPAYPANFPQRNRLISGLALGVLVVEAGQESGALLTARYALEQGREVFALPGPIFSNQSRGTNQLIQEGAKLVSRPEDVVSEFGHLKIDFSSAQIKKSVELEDNEEKILSLLKEIGPASLEEIVSKAKLPAGGIQASLSKMELKNLIRRLDDGTYRALEGTEQATRNK